MEYRRASIEKAQSDLRDFIISEAQEGKKVLWLVSGGSNMKPIIELHNSLPDEITSNLCLMLIHEVYGSPGHSDSIGRQFMLSGLEPKKSQLIPVLINEASFEEIIKHYNNALAEAFADNDVLIAHLGMGTDGHIAGILPHSVAAHTNKLVVGYEHDELQKLTITLSTLEMMDAIYVFAYGEHKRDAIMRLRDVGLAAEDQPAQFLKQLPNVYFYNDQVGE